MVPVAVSWYRVNRPSIFLLLFTFSSKGAAFLGFAVSAAFRTRVIGGPAVGPDRVEQMLTPHKMKENSMLFMVRFYRTTILLCNPEAGSIIS
jgi:hypothetical protein